MSGQQQLKPPPTKMTVSRINGSYYVTVITGPVKLYCKVCDDMSCESCKEFLARFPLLEGEGS